MVTIRNCQDQRALSFTNFCIAQFEWKCSGTISFSNKCKNQGWYRSEDNLVVIHLHQEISALLYYTIAHNLRHAQQHMHNLLPEPYSNARECDAHETAKIWIEEYNQTHTEKVPTISMDDHLEIEFGINKVTFKGTFNHEMVDIVKFIFETQFELTKDVTIIFEFDKLVSALKPKKVLGCYDKRKNTVNVAILQSSWQILWTIAHELKHHEQAQRDAIPIYKRNNHSSQYEREASKFASKVTAAFYDHQKEKGTYEERHIFHRYQW